MITVREVSIDVIPEPDRGGLRDWCSQHGLATCYLAADCDGALGWFGYANKPAVMNRGSREWGWVDERSDRGLYSVHHDAAMTIALCAAELHETVYRVVLESQAEPEPAPTFDPYKAMLA